MQLLTTLPRPVDENGTIRVYYANGFNRQGIVDVDGAQSYRDPPLAAELAALHHVLVTLDTYGVTQTGKNLTITVANARVRKVMQKSPDVRDALALGHFLRTRFADATVKIASKDDWIKPRAEQHIDRVTVLPILAAHAQMHSLGDVVVSEHALSRFIERSSAKEPSRAWSNLTGTMMRATRFVPRSYAVNDVAADEDARSSAVFFDELERWELVVVPHKRHDNLPVLATCMPAIRPPQHEAMVPRMADIRRQLKLEPLKN